MKKSFIATVALLAGVGNAFADGVDVYAPASFKDAPPLILPPTWAGAYFGIHGGYATGEWDGQLVYDDGYGPVKDVWDRGQSVDGDGWLVGIQGGYNVQRGNFVIGLEVDTSWTDFEGDERFKTIDGYYRWSVEHELEWFGTARTRVGYAFNSFLVFASGGVAYGESEANLNVHHLYFETPTKTANGKDEEDHVGWAAGAGVEWLIRPNWTVKAEWLHVDLGDADYHLKGRTTDGHAHTTDSFESELEFDVFRVGVNYKFGQ